VDSIWDIATGVDNNSFWHLVVVGIGLVTMAIGCSAENDKKHALRNAAVVILSILLVVLLFPGGGTATGSNDPESEMPVAGTTTPGPVTDADNYDEEDDDDTHVRVHDGSESNDDEYDGGGYGDGYDGGDGVDVDVGGGGINIDWI
jgi:hypothetical protein